jgi:protein-S-isoprenylcysteine O-methyltransferase Ste14
MSRATIFLYGVLSYAVFFAVFLYGMGFIVGTMTPTMLDGVPKLPFFQALGINLGLLSLFAIQHSGMARQSFKRWLTHFVPVSAERSTYVLMSSLALALLFAFWQPMGGVVWNVTSVSARSAIIGLYLLGWMILLYATFLIDHFDLFGLKQVWRALVGETYKPPQFHTPGMYRIVRHPLYVGWIIIFWAAPTMTLAHLVFAGVATAYILVAIQFEERDLVAAFGEAYESYRSRTPMLVPRLWARRRAVKTANG